MAGIVRTSSISAARDIFENILGVAAASVLLFATLIPFLFTLPFGLLGSVCGLWTTALLNGIVLVATFRYTSAIAASEGPLRARDHLSIVETYRTGLGIGVGTFLVGLVGLIAVSFPTMGAFRWVSLGFAAGLCIFWYMLVAFSNEELGKGETHRDAFAVGLARFASAPLAVFWFLVASCVLAVLGGLTVVTAVVVLPGALSVLASTITALVDRDVPVWS